MIKPQAGPPEPQFCEEAPFGSHRPRLSRRREQGRGSIDTKTRVPNMKGCSEGCSGRELRDRPPPLFEAPRGPFEPDPGHAGEGTENLSPQQPDHVRITSVPLIAVSRRARPRSRGTGFEFVTIARLGR